MKVIKADLELNLEGLLCPLPLIRISQNIGKVPINGILKAIADDPGSLADLPAWARTTGNELIDINREGSVNNFFIRRLK